MPFTPIPPPAPRLDLEAIIDIALAVFVIFAGILLVTSTHLTGIR